MSTRKMSLDELLSSSFGYQASGIYTAIPAQVVGIRDGLQGLRVDVQPSIDMRNKDGSESSKRPPIANVPLQMPISTLGGLTFPVKKGDPVMVIFSMRGLDVWKKGDGSPDMPSDMRTFSMRDAMAIPCLYPSQKSPNSSSSRSMPHSTDDVVLVHGLGGGSEVEIRLKPSGDVEINSPKKVTINCEDAEVNSKTCTVNTDDCSVNSKDFTVDSSNVTFKSGSFVIQTGSYSMSATNSASSLGTISHSGSFVLNGTPIEGHKHSGVQPGGSDTDPFGG